MRIIASLIHKTFLKYIHIMKLQVIVRDIFKCIYNNIITDIGRDYFEL